MNALFVLVLSFFFLSCWEKPNCKNSIGNADIVSIAFMKDNSLVKYRNLKEWRFFYKTHSGKTDTLKYDINAKLGGDLSSEFAVINFGTNLDSVGTSISLLYFPSALVQGRIKDNALYIKHPQGNIDTMLLKVVNQEGCNADRLWYHFQGLEFNGQEAEFLHKAPPGKLGRGFGTNAFVVHI